MYQWKGGDSSETYCRTTSTAGNTLMCAITPTKTNSNAYIQIRMSALLLIYSFEGIFKTEHQLFGIPHLQV